MIGQTISHYRIVEKIGEGGMGVVYLASDIRLQRQVALKFLPPEMTRDTAAKERFMREAKAASLLDHPNVCTILEIDETAEGQVFMAMPYYKGQTLKDLIAAGAEPRVGPGTSGNRDWDKHPPGKTPADSPLTVSQAVDIAIQIASGLARAHEAGIIHRDIKSTNICLTAHGEAKIMDFGLAKLKGQTQLTQSRTVRGTIAYMSPEQARGEEIDERSDLWSLGVVMYEMATGRLPFWGEYDQAVAYSLINEKHEPVSGINPALPAEFGQIIDRCLEKERDRRFTSVAELREALEDMRLRVQLPEMSKKKWAFRAASWTHKQILIAFGAALAVVLVAWAFLSPRSPLAGLLSRPGIEVNHLAILPFQAASGDDESRMLARGFMEVTALRANQLERFSAGTWIVSLLHVFTLMKSSKLTIDAAAARREWGINRVINGSFVQASGNVQLRLDLSDAETQKLVRTVTINANLGDLSLFQQGLIKKLAELLKIRLDSADVENLSISGTVRPDAHKYYLLGKGFCSDESRPENIDRSLDSFQQAIRCDSRYADAWAGWGEACLKKYQLSKEKTWLEESEKKLHEAIRLSPRIAYFYFMLAMIYEQGGSADKAADETQKAIALDNRFFNAYVQLAWIYLRNDKIDRAEQILKRAIAIRKECWQPYEILGYLYQKINRNDEAIRYYLQSLELATQKLSILNALGVIYLNRGEYRNAWEKLKEAYKIRPDPFNRSNLASASFYGGLYSAALPLYQEAVKADPENPVFMSNLGDVYRQIPGSEAEALTAYREAIRLFDRRLQSNPEDAENRIYKALCLARSKTCSPAQKELSRALASEKIDTLSFPNVIMVNELCGRRTDALALCRTFLERLGNPEQLRREPDLAALVQDSSFLNMLKK